MRGWVSINPRFVLLEVSFKVTSRYSHWEPAMTGILTSILTNVSPALYHWATCYPIMQQWHGVSDVPITGRISLYTDNHYQISTWNEVTDCASEWLSLRALITSVHNALQILPNYSYPNDRVQQILHKCRSIKITPTLFIEQGIKVVITRLSA